LTFPIKINNRIASLLRRVSTGDGKSIASGYPIFQDLSDEVKVQTDKLQQVPATIWRRSMPQRAKLEWRPSSQMSRIGGESWISSVASINR
jgi:hypothetical protein